MVFFSKIKKKFWFFFQKNEIFFDSCQWLKWLTGSLPSVRSNPRWRPCSRWERRRAIPSSPWSSATPVRISSSWPSRWYRPTDRPRRNSWSTLSWRTPINENIASRCRRPWRGWCAVSRSRRKLTPPTRPTICGLDCARSSPRQRYALLLTSHLFSHFFFWLLTFFSDFSVFFFTIELRNFQPLTVCVIRKEIYVEWFLIFRTHVWISIKNSNLQKESSVNRNHSLLSFQREFSSFSAPTVIPFLFP